MQLLVLPLTVYDFFAGQVQCYCDDNRVRRSRVYDCRVAGHANG